jgi:protein-S-isoprenylcysteine O-methyltransferase Ste14
MEPYFLTNHIAGVLMTTTTAAWGMMELAQRTNGPQREGAMRVGGGRHRLVVLACLIATALVVNFAPHVVPAAAIRPGAVAFAIGYPIMLGGLVLRGWSFKALGTYFTHVVMVSSDQPVIATGPYRLLRHPSYTGILLAALGLGLAAANWAGLAVLMLLVTTPLLVRIHTEENALLATLGDRYRGYAKTHKRLVPLVW